MNSQMYEEMNEVLNDAKQGNDTGIAITAAAMLASATAIVPIPVADMAMLIPIQVGMMIAICHSYNIDIKENKLKTLASAVIGTVSASALGKTAVRSAFKLIPGIGTIAGGVLCASTAAAITAALGEAFTKLCQKIKDGELTESDLGSEKGAETLKQFFAESLKKRNKSGREE